MNPARAFGPAVVSGYLQGDTISTHAVAIRHKIDTGVH